MKMYVDLDQYLLTASFLTPSVVVSYAVLWWLAKLLAKLSKDALRLPVLWHVACIVLACAAAPIVALWFTKRPADLMDGSGKSLLVGAIAALGVIAVAEETARRKARASSEVKSQ